MKQNPLPDAVAALFPTATERSRVEDWLTGELQRARRRIQAGPVAPTVDMPRFARNSRRSTSSRPRPLEEMLRWTIERMEHGIVQMANPRYFGLFNPGRQFSGAMRRSHRERVQSAAGEFGFLARAGGTGTVTWYAPSRAAPRSPDGAAGHFATGGSESNYTALLCALTGGASRICGRRGARLCGTGQDLYLARLPHRLAEGRAPGRSGPCGAASGRHRRPRPHGSAGAVARHSAWTAARARCP